MQMRVREQDDRVYIELDGVAGRHNSVLRAVSQCRLVTAGADPDAAADVSVRSGANAMRICFQARPGLRVDARQVYRSFRDALFAPLGNAATPAS